MNNEWEPAVRAFEKKDLKDPPPDHPLVFTGSSSIAMWDTLREDLPAWPVLNRGFGGSQMSDLVHFRERVITRYQPRGVIIYSGDNDLAAGKRPEAVQESARQLAEETLAEVADTRLAFLSVKYSPARLQLADEIAELNDLLGTLSEAEPAVHYLDVASCLLDDEGQPEAECFVEDGLHLTPEGYRRWKSVILPYLKDRYEPRP